MYKHYYYFVAVTIMVTFIKCSTKKKYIYIIRKSWITNNNFNLNSVYKFHIFLNFYICIYIYCGTRTFFLHIYKYIMYNMKIYMVKEKGKNKIKNINTKIHLLQIWIIYNITFYFNKNIMNPLTLCLRHIKLLK
jgi:hypothetical protein